jgi:hypothetical protein
MSQPKAPIEASSWTEFLTAIRETRQTLNAQGALWYRGQSKFNYDLVPSLLRNSRWPEKEHALFNEYERSASHLLESRQNSWEMLEDMQHYGIPTRLLDWTDVLGVAVAFALYDSNESEDSAVFVLDPLKLNEKSGLNDIKRASFESNFDYKSVYWQGQPFYPNFPIAIDGRLHNDRLRAQSGSFTVHGRDNRPLDEQAPEAAQKIVLRSSAKPEAREFLEHANLTPFRIYPDLVGMAQHIIRKYLR